MNLFKNTNELKHDNACLKFENELVTKFIRKLNSSVGVSTLIETIINEITTAIDAETSTLYSVGSDNTIHFTYVYGGDEKTIEKLKKMTLKIGDGIVGSAISSGRSEYVEDAAQDKRLHKSVDASTGFVTKSILCTPLKLENSVIGAIQVINKKGNKKFSKYDIILLERLAEIAAFALQKEKMHEKIIYEKNFNEYIIENIAEGVFVVDKDLKILSLNSRLLEMTGNDHSNEPVLGQHVDNLFGYLNLIDVYEKVFKEGLPYRQSEKEARSLQFNLIPRKNKDDIVTEVLTIVKSKR